MPARPPPIPPANRGPKGPGSPPDVPTDTAPNDRAVPGNIEQQRDQANTRQNTTDEGIGRIGEGRQGSRRLAGSGGTDRLRLRHRRS